MRYAYYNEIEPFAAQWLRNLIGANLIAPGEVDERSIADVQPTDLQGFRQCHFFAGIGVWSYALRCAGWPDDRPIWTGSCPCQPFSAAGKRGGFSDERHLWPQFGRLIQGCHPVRVLGEQVSGADGLKWVDVVSADLEDLDYTFGAIVANAASVGAPHIRQRLYWVADSEGERGRGRVALEEGRGGEPGRSSAHVCHVAWPDGCGSGSSLGVPDVLSPSYGVAGRVGRLRAYGNALCAPVAQAFVEAVMECCP